MRLRLIALALMTGGPPAASVAQPVAQPLTEQPRIVVDGYGEVKTMPDIATIGYTLRGEGSTSDEAVRAMVASGAQIEKALKSIDPNADPRTSDIKISPAKGSDCNDDRYDREDDRLSNGACAIVGYVATQDITVRTSAVKDSGTMVGLAARGGAYSVRVQSFAIGDVRPAKKAALAVALADAQAKATAIAAGSHVTLGPIISISTVGHEPGELIVVTGSRIRPKDVVNQAPVTVNLKAEQITTNASVTVAYSIGQ
jgi:uncharacterized protein YggE